MNCLKPCWGNESFSFSSLPPVWFWNQVKVIETGINMENYRSPLSSPCKVWEFSLTSAETVPGKAQRQCFCQEKNAPTLSLHYKPKLLKAMCVSLCDLIHVHNNKFNLIQNWIWLWNLTHPKTASRMLWPWHYVKFTKTGMNRWCSALYNMILILSTYWSISLQFDLF